jgi:hypothetical protein
MKVTVIVHSKVLRYHPGQIIILDDTPRIRRLIDSGHMELVWSDKEFNDSPENTIDPEQHSKIARSSGSNGTHSESGQRSSGGQTPSSKSGRYEELLLDYQRESGELINKRITPDDERRETDSNIL